MKLWVAKNYWWVVPVCFGIAFSILTLAFNYFPTHFLYHLQGTLPALFVLGAFLYFPVFAIATSVSIYRIHKKTGFSKMLKFLTIGPFVFLFSTLSAAAPLALKPSPLPPHSADLEFNSNDWIAKVQDGNGPFRRQKMIQDLLENHLPDSNCNQIIGLLGSPDNPKNDPLFSDCAIATHMLRYNVGPSQQIFNLMNWDVLQISFSKNGLFETAKLISID